MQIDVTKARCKGPDMPISKPLAALFSGLSRLFAAEGRQGGDAVAQALGQTDMVHTGLRVDPDFDLTEGCKTALSLRPHPIAATILAALPDISWHYAGLDGGRIPADIARKMAAAELIGPDGLFHHPNVRVGLFMQSAGLDYGIRRHVAEETFLMLGGSGYWSCDGSAPALAQTGATLHHPSNAPHGSRTYDEPLIAAWRWTGDIGWDSYELIG